MKKYFKVLIVFFSVGFSQAASACQTLRASCVDTALLHWSCSAGAAEVDGEQRGEIPPSYGSEHRSVERSSQSRTEIGQNCRVRSR